MQDPQAVARRLQSGKALEPEETEASQSIAIQQWALRPSPADATLNALLDTLAERVITNHADLWLKDFISSPLSLKANELLLNSIRLNYSGDADHALRSAALAEKNFASHHNHAGALRARFEQIYALRRLSRAEQCLRNEYVLHILKTRSYQWLEAQTAMELSSCLIMKGRPDRSNALGHRALAISRRARYGNLILRSIALLGNLEMHDGRSRALWEQDISALALFWSAPFPDERAFQLYHDLQQDSETAGNAYAALLLQRETLSMIAGLGRFDFEAMAHFRMAETAGSLGDLAEEKHELDAYKGLLNQLPEDSDAKLLYAAYCNVGLARLAMHSRDLNGAEKYLSTAKPALSTRDNSILQIEYLSTAAEIARMRSDSSSEQRYLESILAIGSRQMDRLRSPSDRWHWQQLQDRARRRSLELKLTFSHLPIETFAAWHRWQALDGVSETSSVSDREWIENKLRSSKGKTLISFVPLEQSTVAWIINARGVHEVILPIHYDRLLHEARAFYHLCSDPGSNIGKVNASGSRLYGMLINPIEKELAGSRGIVIAADSILTLIPWAALRTPRGHYWGQERNLSIHTGFQIGGTDFPGSKQIRKMLIATPGAVTADGISYLPVVQSEEEGRYISKAFPQTRWLRAGESSATRLLEEFSHADGFHYAGHAITRAESGELITDKQGDEPFLTAADIRKARLRDLRLVVLSACSTASVENFSEQNPDGLVKAFVLAGVPTVVASRWDVDSASTALLMKGFYAQLKAGKDPGEALSNATQSLILNNEFQHPYYWSAFQVFSAN